MCINHIITTYSQVFDFNKEKHQEIFNAIDTNNDGFIAQKEWLKITSLASDQSVIPISRIYEIFRDINTDNNVKGISAELWMKAVTSINLEKIPNNKNNKNDNDDKHLSSVHIMTVLKCIDNVWNNLGPGHREGAYQKSLMYDLLDNGYKVEMEKRVPVYHYTKNKKKLYLVSMERIDLFIKYPATVIEMKAVSNKLSVKDEYQTKKYSKNRKYLSFLMNCPNNRDKLEIKCWIISDNDYISHDISQYDIKLN